MKPSVLTMLDLTFMGLHVEINPEFKRSAKGFDYEGALTGWEIRHGSRNDYGTEWWVSLGFVLENSEEKPCPYEINMRAVGRFLVDTCVPESKRESLVYENGAALVFGAIREMISTMTARSAYGMLILPTATFIGSFEKHLEEKRQKADEAVKTEPEAKD